MAISQRTVDFLAKTYAFFLVPAITVFFVYVALTGSYLDMKGRPLLAVVGGLGLLLIFWLFYVKWFVTPSQFIYPTWPPYLSTCPDYLTFMGIDPKTNKAMCVDFIGVARRNGLRRADPTIPPKPSETDYIFLTDPTDNSQKKCTSALSKGLSWAGITAGTGCA